jgi:uncharacterized protein YjbI with pentapeptide repeats
MEKKIRQIEIKINMERSNEFLKYIAKAEANDENITKIVFPNIQLKGEEFTEHSFHSVIFENCIFEEVSFKDCSFNNTLFLGSTFVSCDFSYSWFCQCKFEKSQYRNAVFSDGKFSHLSMEECNLNYANFTYSKIENCEIINSDLSGAFFSDCALKNFYPEKTKFSGTDFFHTPLKGIDFTSCIIDGICVSDDWNELREMTVNTFQAAELAKFLGVNIKSD